MTAVVGIEYPGGVVLAADRLGSTSSYAAERVDVKVWRRTTSSDGAIAIGGWGDYRLLQTLRHADLPPLPIGQRPGIEHWLVRTFIPWLRGHLRDAGCLKANDGVDRMTDENGAGILVALRGELWEVDSDFQVGRTAHGYNANGSGAHYALGALRTMLGDDGILDTAEAPAQTAATFAAGAIHAAAYFNPHVGGGVDVVNVR